MHVGAHARRARFADVVRARASRLAKEGLLTAAEREQLLGVLDDLVARPARSILEYADSRSRVTVGEVLAALGILRTRAHEVFIARVLSANGYARRRESSGARSWYYARRAVAGAKDGAHRQENCA